MHPAADPARQARSYIATALPGSRGAPWPVWYMAPSAAQLVASQLARTTRIAPDAPGGPAGPRGPASPLSPGGPAGPASPFSPCDDFAQPARLTAKVDGSNVDVTGAAS